VSALERIAELHSDVGDLGTCAECGDVWPCPTRRLVTEDAVGGGTADKPLTLGDVERMGWNVAERLADDVREARADADRLAEAMRAAVAGRSHEKFSVVLAAYDAARTKEGL
jgi:hypothetical protein